MISLRALVIIVLRMAGFDARPTGAVGELYDKENDQIERYNLVHDKEYSDIVINLQRQLLQWHISCSGGFTM